MFGKIYTQRRYSIFNERPCRLKRYRTPTALFTAVRASRAGVKKKRVRASRAALRARHGAAANRQEIADREHTLRQIIHTFF
jgi:hypothetical protein